MDGVFNIIKKDGTTINMLQNPGMLAEDDLVPAWILDLTVLGVWDHATGKRLPVCPQDVKNLDMSGDALYNSSSLNLQEDITTTLTEEEQTGPSMLHAVIFKIQQPSKATTKLLEEKAGEISLRDIPAENVQEYNKLMIPILKDIKRSIMTGQVLPDLTSIALDGLNTTSDPALYNIVSLHMSGDALYNSSSLDLQEDITTTLTEEEQTGPSMLHAVIFKIQRPSKARTKLLEEKAGESSLRDTVAENVQEYNKLMIPILKDIKRSIMPGQVLPDLTSIALDGLNTTSDPTLYNVVSLLCIAHDRDSKPNTTQEDKLQAAIKVLKDVESAWTVRCLSKRYGPAITRKAAEIKANLAAALGQQRAASSTTGNATRTKPKCWDCESETHLRGDPACPHKGGKAAHESASKAKSKFTPKHGLNKAEVQRLQF